MRPIFRIAIVAIILIPLLIVGYVFREHIFKYAEKKNEPLAPSVDLRAISQKKVLGFFVDRTLSDAPNLYYLSYDGIHRIVWGGKVDSLIAPFPARVETQNVMPSSGGMIIKTRSDLLLFTPYTKGIAKFPETVTAASPNPDGSRVAMLIRNETSSRLVVGTVDDTSSTTIFSFSQSGLTLAWPSAQTLYLTELPYSLAESRVYVVDIASSTIQNSIPAGTGLMVSFEESGPRALIFRGSTGIGSLVLSDITSTATPIALPTTLPSKCAWGASALYCGVPQTFTAIFGRSFLDEYLMRGFYSVDTLYRIDLKTHEAAPVSFPAPLPPLDISHPVFLENQNLLLFVNRYDQKLYSLALP